MKSFVSGLVLVVSLGLTLAALQPSVIDKEEQAIQECNATIAVHRNPRIEIATGIATGERIKLSQEEKCFMHCFLQKVGFLDENADIKNGPGLVKYTIKSIPDLAKYSEVVIAQIFQIKRSAKAFEDKCQKAFVVFHQYAQGTFVLAIADGLQSFTGVKDQIINSVQNGGEVDKHLTKNVSGYLKYFDKLVSSYANELAALAAQSP